MDSGSDDANDAIMMLEFVVRELVLRDCRAAPDPSARHAEWQAALRKQGDIHLAAGVTLVNKHGDDALILQCARAADKFEKFGKDLAAHFAVST